MWRSPSVGVIHSDEPTLTRVHSECLTGDTLGSLRCDCGDQLDMALRQIGRRGRGVVLYLRGHEGRGIGLGHKLEAYALQDRGSDTVEANRELGLPVDARQYQVGAQILKALGARTISLMTNNPKKVAALAALGLDVVDRVPLLSAPRRQNVEYLRTKELRLGHLLRLADSQDDRDADGAILGEASGPDHLGGPAVRRQATIEVVSAPQEPISILTTSPTARKSPRGSPTPAGVPVAMTSPGRSVSWWLSHSICS